jgi:hypothetical protein
LEGDLRSHRCGEIIAFRGHRETGRTGWRRAGWAHTNAASSLQDRADTIKGEQMAEKRIDSNRYLVVVHGEKGGVGKSTVAALLVDLAPSKPLIVECDHASPDVARRYQHHGYEGLSFALLGPDSPADVLCDLMSALQDAPEALILVNLPGSAGVVVDEYAEQIRAVADGTDRKLVVVYVIGAGADSVESAQRCARTGLASVADKRIAVINTYFGRAARIGWDAGNACRDWNGPVVELPALTDRVTEKVRAIDGPLRQIVNGTYGNLPYIDRSFMERWLRECAPIAGAAYDQPVQ